MGTYSCRNVTPADLTQFQVQDRLSQIISFIFTMLLKRKSNYADDNNNPTDFVLYSGYFP